MAAPADHSDNGAVSTAAHLELDPLLLELGASVGPPAWVDPTLEELVTSFIMSWPAGVPADASLVDTRSPTKTAQGTTVRSRWRLEGV